jgi:TPR repeat protein
MTATKKPGLSGAVRHRGGKFQSSQALTREYDCWIDRFQKFSGPTFIARARRALPGAFFDEMVVPLALAMQRKSNKGLREQGTRGLVELADAGVNLARYNLAVQRTATPEQQSSAFELMSIVAATETADTYLKGLALAGMGECYENGHGVERDEAKAHEYFEQAAEYGVAEAAFNVGLYHDDKAYARVRGPVDLEKAARYYERGAALGDVPCMTNLGILYATHRLGDDKAAQGRELLEQASAKGDHVARQVIGALGSIDAMHADAPAADLSSVLVRRF